MHTIRLTAGAVRTDAQAPNRLTPQPGFGAGPTHHTVHHHQQSFTGQGQTTSRLTRPTPSSMPICAGCVTSVSNFSGQSRQAHRLKR